MMKKRVCPKCLTKLDDVSNGMNCPNCGEFYKHGETVYISLSQALKVASREASLNRPRTTTKKYAKTRRKGTHSTGFYGVTRTDPCKGKPRGSWRYKSVTNGLNIQRVDLEQLKKDVCDAGGKWEIVNDKVAEESLKLNKELFEKEVN